MKIDKLYTRKSLISLIILILLVGIFGLYKVYSLRIAHSSFENYYSFRGCVQLLEKTETYATCKLSSGETIKIVKVGTRWFLDGDFGW